MNRALLEWAAEWLALPICLIAALLYLWSEYRS